MSEEFTQIVYWFGFILGLATFGGLCIAIARSVRTPAAEREELADGITQLTKNVEALRSLVVSVRKGDRDHDERFVEKTSQILEKLVAIETSLKFIAGHGDE